MRRLAFFACLSIGTPAALAADAGGPFAIELAPGTFDERCIRLEAGQAIRYHFGARAPVDFNIHFHRGKEVHYPVRAREIRNRASVFRAQADEDYCLMWKNNGSDVVPVMGSIERAD